MSIRTTELQPSIRAAERNLEQALIDLRGAKDGRGLFVYLAGMSADSLFKGIENVWMTWCDATKSASRSDEAAAARNLALVANAYAARLEYDLVSPPELRYQGTAGRSFLLG